VSFFEQVPDRRCAYADILLPAPTTFKVNRYFTAWLRALSATAGRVRRQGSSQHQVFSLLKYKMGFDRPFSDSTQVQAVPVHHPHHQGPTLERLNANRKNLAPRHPRPSLHRWQISAAEQQNRVYSRQMLNAGLTLCPHTLLPPKVPMERLNFSKVPYPVDYALAHHFLSSFAADIPLYASQAVTRPTIELHPFGVGDRRHRGRMGTWNEAGETYFVATKSKDSALGQGVACRKFVMEQNTALKEDWNCNADQ
jgi:hypothetical protein